MTSVEEILGEEKARERKEKRRRQLLLFGFPVLLAMVLAGMWFGPSLVEEVGGYFQSDAPAVAVVGSACTDEGALCATFEELPHKAVFQYLEPEVSNPQFKLNEEFAVEVYVRKGKWLGVGLAYEVTDVEQVVWVIQLSR